MGVVEKSVNEVSSERVEKFLSTNAGFLAPDPEIVRNHRMEPRSDREEEAMQKCDDPHLIRDVSSRLISILDESFEISEQTVAAPAGKFADLATAFMTANGDISLLSNRGVAAFATILGYPVKFCLKYFSDDPSVGIKDGDAFLQNDARYGGIHSPDQGMAMPVFYKGELVAWTVVSMHEGEIGARPPGGMGPSIESPYEEGFRGSPMKIAEKDMLKTDLVTLLQNSCREESTMLVDLRARLATCIRLRDQLIQVLDTHGSDVVIATLRQTPEFVGEETARRIQEMPNGTARTTLFSDTTMREPALMKIEAALTIDDNRMILDLRGSSPEIANRPLNCPFSGVSTGVLLGIMHFVWPDLPKSAAILENLEILTDPESIFDASYDVPIALNMHCVFKLITATEILFSKLAYSVPEKYATVKAPWYNQPAGMMYGGETQHGSTVGNLCAELNGMGGGARHHLDGEHSLAANFAAMVDTGEAELSEDFLPYIQFTSRHLEADTGSFGKHRGGQGYQIMYVRYGTQPFGFQTVAGGSKFPSTVGLFGGYGCATYPVAKIKGVNLFEELKENPEWEELTMSAVLNERPFKGATYEAVPYNMEFELAYEGEMYINCQGAGGGYGDVLERDPELVMKDVVEQLISHDTAKELYKVVYNESNLVVDVEATRNARKEARLQRIKQGKTYDDFVRDHIKASPPSGVLYFGSWNGSEKLYGGMFQALPGDFPTPIFMPDPKEILNVMTHRHLVTSEDDRCEENKPEHHEVMQNALNLKTIVRMLSITALMFVMIGEVIGVGFASLLKKKDERLSAFFSGLGKSVGNFLHRGGPTFIKLGQVLSMRPDLLPDEMIANLKYLQDDVAPMPFSAVKEIIEEDLGKPLSEIYAEIDKRSLAAGSVAQVHKATLHDGRVVAVKVLRKNLDKSFEQDLRVLSVFARLGRLVPGVAAVGIGDILDEFGGALHKQLNFRGEVDNNRALAKAYKHLEWVKLPEVHDDYSGDSVITMEFIVGKKCSEHMADRGHKPDTPTAKRLYQLYLDMAFVSQVLHVDLHEGNLLIDDEGRFVLLDTGLVNHLPSYYVRRYIRAYLCVGAADGYLQVDNYFGGRKHLLPAEKRMSLAKGLDVLYKKFEAERTSDFTIMWLEVLNELRKNDAQLDREFVMMMVADMTMAGMARQFDPGLDVVELLKQELPNMIFHEHKLALNDPFLIAALRPDLLKQIRTATLLEEVD